jgi:hypothetical protein
VARRSGDEKRPPEPGDARAVPDPEAERAARRSRGREELLEVRPDRSAPFPSLEVRNPGHGTRYRVLWPTYPLSDPLACDCADFAHRGLGTCKHIEAVRLWAVEHEAELARPPAVSVPAVGWEEIDAAWAAPPGVSRLTPRRLRWAERTLLA